MIDQALMGQDDRGMDVCLISWTATFGGVEMHIIALAHFLIERGHQVTLSILGRDVFGSRLQDLGPKLTVIRSPLSGNESLSTMRDVLGRMPGEVCVLEKGCVGTGTLGFDIAARLRFRRYVTIEQLEPARLPEKTSRRYLFGLVRGFGLWWHKRRLDGYMRSVAPQRIICVSDGVRRRLKDDYLFSPRKLIMTRNGVNTNTFIRDLETRKRIRKEWQVSAETVVFGAVGRFAAVKRFDVAIQAFAQLSRERSSADLRMVLVGEGDEQKSLQRTIAAHGLEKRVMLLPFTTRPWEALNALDVFVMPSATEGLPFALLEALACELCPIATDVGGNAEVVDKEIGWLVPACDIDAFVAAMRAAVDCSAEERAQMGRRARERIMSSCDSRAQLEAIARLIEQDRFVWPGPSSPRI